MTDIQAMIGKEVDVIANGMKYSGVLIEVSDVEVHIKGPFQWLSLPVSTVSDITLKEATGKGVSRAEEESGTERAE